MGSHIHVLYIMCIYDAQSLMIVLCLGIIPRCRPPAVFFLLQVVVVGILILKRDSVKYLRSISSI